MLAVLALPVAAAAATTRVQKAELSPEAEAAIDRGLRYLAAHQNKADGSWGSQYRPAMTALTLMAFMVKGHFPGRGRYGRQLDQAVGYLLKRGEDEGGYLGSSRQGMYEHGLATLALSEIWGMSDQKGIRQALKRAVDIILESQNAKGGWRYEPKKMTADVSVTVMQIVALASAQEAGVLVPKHVVDKAIAYIKSCKRNVGGRVGFGYQPHGHVRFSSTAAGTMSLMMCGQRDSEEVKQGLEYLKKEPDSKFERTEFYGYAHYYAIQCMYQAGEEDYQTWYPKIRNALLKKQRPDGCWSGFERGDASYATSIAILVLGVPYRFLPIYQR